MKKHLYTIVALCSIATMAQAQAPTGMAQPRLRLTQVATPQLGNSHTIDLDTVELKPGTLFMPLVFSHQQGQKADFDEIKEHGQQDYTSQWIDDAIASHEHVDATRYRAMVTHPQVTQYNINTLPVPPKEHVVTPDPAKNRLSVSTAQVETPAAIDPIIERGETRVLNWLHTAEASLHFTQAYISQNWYQGGENNINVLGDFRWTVALNQKLHPNYLFENDLHYKLGVMTAHSDTLRNYAINEDNFLLSSKFGYKAIKNWYYSATLLFKTQFFNAYKSNSNKLTASFLSPGELNLGLGMTYNYKDKEEFKVLSLSIAPLSYNMKMCRDITKLDPTTFGIKTGQHTRHTFGSNLECKFLWKMSANISWNTRFYVFTNYEYAQGDWENTLDFSITRHLNTQIYTHLRYDKSRPRHDDWKYWQFKEILSFGLTYKFSTH